LGDNHALVDLPARAVPEDALVPALGLLAGPQPTAHDHELRGDATRLGDEADAVQLLEVAIEVAGENAVERGVWKRQVERVALDERRLREPRARDLDHRVALVESDHLAAKVLRHEPGAAGDIERPYRRKVGDPALQRSALIVPPRWALLAVESPREPPVVVLTRA